MKALAATSFKVVWTALWVILTAPFLIPAFLLVKLLGGDPFSMDDMGAGFGMMCMIALGLAVATAAFAVGYML
jgi:hypothetical protein